MIIERFKESDLHNINAIEAAGCIYAMVSDPVTKAIILNSDSWTGIIDGRIVACCGLIKLGPYRGYCWALLAADIGAKGLLKVTKAAIRYLDLQQFPRIDAVVVAVFEQGQRWMKVLGFELETPLPMRNYLNDGRDAYMYARIR